MAQGLSALSSRVVGFALLGATMSTPAAAQEAPSFKVGARLQGWYQAVEAGALDGSTLNDFVLRRGYVHLTGTFPSDITLFAHVAADRVGQQGLDNPGIGLGSGLALRDAWIAWSPTPAFRLQLGRMYVPFTRTFGTESTFTLLTVDLPSSQGGTRGGIFYASKVGRDDGLVVWGTPLEGRLQYRLGVMEGVEGASNPSDSLRVAGRVAVNLLEPETTWFNRGTYLGTKRVLALAVGFDRQANLVAAGGRRFDSQGWTVDAFFDHPLRGGGAVTVEGGFTDVDGVTQTLPFTGLTPGADARIGYAQAGYLLPRPIGPGRLQFYGRYETIDGAGDDTSFPAVGANYLIRGHDVKATFDWSWIDRDRQSTRQVITIQLQLGI